MRAGIPLLSPADVQGGRVEVDLIPAQVYKFAYPQAMPIGDQHHGVIAVAVAVALGGLKQLLDFGLGQVLTGPVFSVWLAPWSNCALFGVRSDQLEVRSC